ncbi:MAG: hypothetical protein Q4G49_14890 [Paracoccus sp. (in: a-proteobacteria)]|nr:hypothetical protein [Paracoccus sp. (in: a-proteobacteria)]
MQAELKSPINNAVKTRLGSPVFICRGAAKGSRHIAAKRRCAAMLLALLISGMISGLAVALLAFLAGLGVVMLLPAYSLAGTAGMMIAAAVLAWRPGAPDVLEPEHLPV